MPGSSEGFPFQLAISSVDSHWRAVALSLPRLWSTIVFHCHGLRDRTVDGLEVSDPRLHLDLLSLWIERSAPYLLDLTFKFTATSYCLEHIALQFQLAMNRVIPHISRWSRLTIQRLPAFLVGPTMASLRTASAHRLQHLGITVLFDRPYSDDYRIFTGGAPALTSVSVVGLRKILPPLVGLTTLNFGGILQQNVLNTCITLEFLRDMLTSSPSLAELTLQTFKLVPSTSTFAGSIHMPSLRTLSLSFTHCDNSFPQILMLLTMPVLETLSLVRMNKAHMVKFQALSRAGAPDFTSFRTLKLIICGPFLDELIEPPEFFFSVFSSITHLYLISTSDFLLEPTSHHSGDDIHWPNLEAATFAPYVFPKVIQSRISRGHPITRVHVPHDCLSSNATLWAFIHDEIQVLQVDNADIIQSLGDCDRSGE